MKLWEIAVVGIARSDWVEVREGAGKDVGTGDSVAGSIVCSVERDVFSSRKG